MGPLTKVNHQELFKHTNGQLILIKTDVHTFIYRHALAGEMSGNVISSI